MKEFRDSLVWLLLWVFARPAQAPHYEEADNVVHGFRMADVFLHLLGRGKLVLQRVPHRKWGRQGRQLETLV